MALCLVVGLLMSDVFSITRSDSLVILLSAHRMPHRSRKSPMDPARRQLREAIESLDVSPGQIIEGVYSSQIEGYFDVENVAFYNIEPATFRNAAKNGLRARRCRLHSDALSPGFPHKLEYQLTATPSIPSNCLVHLSFTPSGLSRVFDVWWAAGEGQITGAGAVTGAYGIYVELGSPTPLRSPAGKIKVLLDGVIAALQRDPEPDPVAVERLARKHQVDASSIKERLSNPIASVVTNAKEGRLVRPFKAGVQWNPADDRCEEITLVLAESPSLICNVYLYALASHSCAS